MDVAQAVLQRNSEEDFKNKFSMFVDSGSAVIHVRAQETVRCLLALRKQVLADNGEYREWDVVNGFREYSASDMNDLAKKGDGNIDIASAFSAPMDDLCRLPNAKVKYYVYVSPHVYMENNPHMSQLLVQYAAILPSTNICVVLLTPDVPLPGEVPVNLLTLRLDSPGLAELKASLGQIVTGVALDFDDSVALSEEEVEKVCYVGAGMTAHNFETYASLAIVEAAREGKTSLTAEDIIKGVAIGKTDVVNSNDILELYPSASIDSVGGMENLKEWIAKRAKCYSDEAREFGVEAPKGIVLVGIPGTGKSLVAKAASSVLGVPLVRLDFGRVFNSLVGASEGRMRTALHMIETMAPVVLLADEIDKGLGGMGGSGDSGVSSRVLGSFLTWLNDCQYPVFTIVTANNVTGLPPELLRRGRFDAIFSTALPTPTERYDVLKIHLSKRGRDITEYDVDSVQRVIDLSEGYVPAEIESAVKDALIDAFSANEDMDMGHVESAVKTMVPLSTAFKAQIEQMGEWAKNNATPVSKAVSTTADLANRRRVIKRKRTSD